MLAFFASPDSSCGDIDVVRPIESKDRESVESLRGVVDISSTGVGGCTGDNGGGGGGAAAGGAAVGNDGSDPVDDSAKLIRAPVEVYGT